MNILYVRRQQLIGKIVDGSYWIMPGSSGRTQHIHGEIITVDDIGMTVQACKQVKIPWNAWPSGIFNVEVKTMQPVRPIAEQDLAPQDW